MHFVFIAYGMKDKYDTLIMDMQAQKHKLRLYKEGEEDRFMWIESQVRIGAFGVLEYVFPKEEADTVLTSLLGPGWDAKHPTYAHISNFKLNVLRKMLQAEKIPEFQRNNSFLWRTKHVSIIPIGVRYDGEIEEVQGELAGWKHERI